MMRKIMKRKTMISGFVKCMYASIIKKNNYKGKYNDIPGDNLYCTSTSH